jgi:Cu(I)/Ag(I) efflux system membrane protein CusA/SilA
VIGRAVAWSSGHPRLVLALALLVGLGSEAARRALCRDVIPELSDPQIVLVAEWMGHPAEEVAATVTAELGRALDGLPGATAVRASSMSGMAYLDVVLASPAALAEARRAIAERVEAARGRLPSEVRVQVGPEASSTGWVFQYALVDPSHGQPPAALRRLQDEVLRPTLAALPGVAEVASVGGGLDELVVDVDAKALRARGLAFSEVVAALRPLFAGLPTDRAALEGLTVRSGAEPARLSDVAHLRAVHGMSPGLADLGGGRGVVGGIVVARRGADVPTVVAAVKAALEAARARLPRGVQVVTVYDRGELTTAAGRSLLVSLAEEVAVVAVVILLFLLHGRSLLVPLATLPLVVVLTFAGMWLLGIPATIMSLGGIGIALGMAVDAEVVALEACHRRLSAEGPAPSEDRRRAALVAAAGSFAPAILTSLIIAALTFLPVFAFTAETGRLLRPLAASKTLVILAAALVAVTVAPALRDRLLGGRVRDELDNPLTRTLVRLYQPFVELALRRPMLTLTTAVLAVVSAIPLVSRLGGEFFPRIDEGDLLFMPTTLPGAPPEEVGGQLLRQDRAIAAFPEVATVFGKAGRADTATDPAPLSMIETTIRLRPRAEWPRVPRERWYSSWAPGFLRPALRLVWPEDGIESTAELVKRLDQATRLPGWTSAWTAPARARLDMMSTGVRTPVGVRVLASAPARLDVLGGELRALMLKLPGTRSAAYESFGGEPRLELVTDPAELARHRVDPAVVQATAALAQAGGHLGTLELDGRRTRVRVAQDLNTRGPADELRALTVPSAAGPIALAWLGHPAVVTRPAAIRGERGALAAYVHVDLTAGTDLLGYVERARAEVARAMAAGELRLEANERVEWTGQYDLLAAGQRRLRFIIPMVALSMLALLFLQFRSLVEAVIVLASVPFALVGSVWTLFLLGYSLSAPVWVGLLSVMGLAMQTGVVMVVYIDAAFHERVRQGRLNSRDDIVAAHAEGTVRRLRPKLMTITTMGASLLPLLWAEGAGAEIMKRIAAPMLGGLVTSAFLTLEVLPVLYTLWRQRQLRVAQRRGVALEKVIGPPPPWARG